MPFRFAAIFLAGCALVSGSAIADAPISVGVRGGPPLATVDSEGNVAGLYAELIEAIADNTADTIDIRVLPFPRLRQYLKDGTLTAVLAIPNSEMLDDSVSAGEVMMLEVIALGREGTRLRSLEGMRGKRICLTRGSSLVPELYRDKRYLLREVSYHDSCPRMLDAGRVDFVVSIRVGLAHLLAKTGKKISDYGEPYLIKRIPATLLVSRRHASQNLVSTLRLAVQKAKDNGTISAIEDKYYCPVQ